MEGGGLNPLQEITQKPKLFAHLAHFARVYLRLPRERRTGTYSLCVRTGEIKAVSGPGVKEKW